LATGLDAQHKIFASNPDDRRAFEALEEHFFLDGDWESLVDLYRARIDAPEIVVDAAQQALLLFRLGQILEERILDLEAAGETYWTLARLDPTNRPALRQLRCIHERDEKWDLVLQIAELESATDMPPYDRAAFETELGRTWQRHLGDSEEALHAYERALEADPDFPAALEALAGLHQEAGRLEEAAEILTRLTTRLRGPERAPVWIALGTLYVNELDDPARARECFSHALDDDPFQPPAVEWSLLLATVDEDWEGVAELLERRFDLASGARHRAAVAVEASQLQLNHQGSRAGARAWTDRALELAPDELSVLLAVAEVERADDDREALLATLDKVITVAGKNAPRSVLVDTAELHSQFGNPDAALAAIRRAGEKRGHDDGRVLTLHAQLLRETGSKRELAEVLETLTALEDEGGILAERLRELARLQEEDLAEKNSAEANWRRAFDLDPAHDEAINALERIYRKRDDWDALRGTFETALAATNGTSRVALSTSLGMLLLEHFDDPQQARTLFDAALAEQPDSRAALGGLRRIAENSGDPELLIEVCEREADGCSDAEQMAGLARTAIPILKDRERIEEALSWAMRWSKAAPQDADAFRSRAEFEARLGRVDDEIESRRKLAKLLRGGERSDCLRRQSELHIQQGDDAAACIALELALEGASGDRETLQVLSSVYRRLERAPELAQTLRLLIDEMPDSERAEPLEELATTLQDPLGDLDAAIVVRWQLADLPSAPDAAGSKLEDLLEMAGRYAELAHLLHTRRQHLGDESEETFELDMRRGRILLDSLGQSEEAAEIFSSLHERHPDNEEILDQLERALRVGDDARGLCDLIERRAGWESDEDRKSSMHLERAKILEEVLGDPLQACDVYEEIIRTHAESASGEIASVRLESLLDSSGQWERLRDRLITRVEGLPKEEQATLRERIAAICLDRLHDIAGCARQLEGIAEIVTDRVHVWQQLSEIYARDLDRPADWLRVVEAELDAGPTPERELSLRVAAARLYLDDERRPNDSDAAEAYRHYERVLAIHPTHAEAAEVLAMHFSAKGRPDETARILESRLDGLRESDGAEVNDLRLRLALLFSTSLEQDDRARTFFETARAELGAIPRVANPLADLYERIGAFEELCDLCRAAIDLGRDTKEQLQWRIRLGASESRRGRAIEAAAAYRTALAESPDDREIEDALIDLYEEIGEIDPLADLLEKRLAYAPEEEVIDLRLRLARLHSEGRNEPLEALQHLEWILESHPQHRDAFDHALRLAEHLGDPDRILDLLDRALDMPLPTTERAEILERRGLLLAEELGRPERAVANLREALSLDRHNHTARQALRRELEKLNRWPAVLDCLFVEANESELEKRIELLEEAAEIAWSRINPDASLPWLARLRAERPEDPELLARFAEVHHRAGRFEAALRAHDDELRLRSDPSRQHDLHIKRARLLERELHAPGRAISAYQSALDLADDKSEILPELDRLYDTMGRPFKRAGILETRVAALDETRDVSESIELRQTLASLYCVEVAKPELALPHLQANVAATRGDAREELIHLGALDAALRASARHDAWASVAERELELIEGDPEILQSTPADSLRFLREELARCCDVELGDPDRAIEHLRILGRSRIEDNGPSADQSTDQFRTLLRRTGRLSELSTNLAEHLGADNVADNGTAAEWLELARLREERLSDLAGAIDAYRQAESDEDCRLDAIRGRRRCCERLRDWDGLTDALESEYAEESSLDRRQRTTIARTLGDVCWQRLGSGERAAAGYGLALELDPDDLATLRSLTDVKEACSEQADAIPLYQREIELLGDETEDRRRRFTVWLRLATLYRDTTESPGDAIEAYKEAASLERLSAPDELSLARLYEAVGDADGFAETFGRWCDREDSGADVRDHLELARQHRTEDENDDARRRAERATAIAPESADAWALLGELEREASEIEKATDAFERAADHAEPQDAANYLVFAAASIDSVDLDRANALLTRAIELDAAALPAHVALTRIANEQERPDQTLCEAEAALELSQSAPLEPDVQLEIALLGGRAARRLDDRDASVRLFEIVLEIDADQTEALEGKAEAHYEDEDFRLARTPLEHRLDLDGENPLRGRHHAMVARGLEADDLLDAAWAQYEEAIEIDPSVEDAHEGLVRVHERAGRPEEALAAVERWASTTRVPETSALAWFRSAEHALSLEDPNHARRSLESATVADPQLASAWVLLCQLVGEQGVDSESRRVCNEALGSIEPSELSAQISLQVARLAEIAGDNEEAIARYAEASRWEPRYSEAALCESRLIRMNGDWGGADNALARFIEAHPDATSPALSHVYLERGRLLSGPLEDFEGAITAYGQALTLQPELAVARIALAGLLLHSANRWREALTLHGQILEASPTTAASLRAIVQLAEQRDQTETAGGALAVLRALGQASPQEVSNAPDALRVPIPLGPPMAEPDAERLRQIAHQLSEEVGSVLADTEARMPACRQQEVAEAMEQIIQIENELTAPRLTALDVSERAAFFGEIAAFFLDPGGNGGESRYRDALDRALGRWTRRKIKRIFEETNLSDIVAFDHEAWGNELRAMAAAQAIDRNGGDLRSVLCALLALENNGTSPANFEGVEIATLASTSESARRLLTHITRTLCERLQHAR
jgi:tetratricopeptide (TPR) repeat protein